MKYFISNCRASSAVEFAIVVGPLLILLFGILELAIVFIVNTGLTTSTAILAKQIRTGQVQAAGLSSTTSIGSQLSLTDAVNQLCGNIQIVSLQTCVKQLQLDIRPLSSFQQNISAPPVTGGNFDASGFCYYSGNPGDIVELRAYYLYKFFNPVLLASLSNVSSYTGGASGKYFLIQAIQVFKTEDFSNSANKGAGC